MELDHIPQNEQGEPLISEEEMEKRKKAFEKEKTSEERFMEVKISEVESTNLERVFKLLVGKKKVRNEDLDIKDS